MQQAQMNGHITPAIDGRDVNWLRGVELLLIAFRSRGNYKNQYTRRRENVAELLTKYETPIT